MKQIIILSLLFLPVYLHAQSLTEYNRRGDAAMDRKDYQTAAYWYEEGVSNCDRYSIDRLTEIWWADTTMRVSMRNAMSRCLNCLNDQAVSNRDTLAIKRLIEYHSVGIGTVVNEAAANNWKEQLEQIRNPLNDIALLNEQRDRMKFFIGFHASVIAPVGIQIGGVGKVVGWYIRFRANPAFQQTQFDGEVVKNQQDGLNYLHIQELDDNNAMYRTTGRNKASCWMGTVGIMFKTSSNFCLSTGVGYFDRKYASEFIRVQDSGADIPGTSDWVRVSNRSLNGVMLDLDGTYAFSNRVYGALGASLLDFKYVYPNIGVGFFF
ncbi:MAG: hypothetical protein LBE56_04260 [Tannerella sp.]|jgi:hypothetical protein|nr:hypothetical protein [Tannerella sp.]